MQSGRAGEGSVLRRLRANTPDHFSMRAQVRPTAAASAHAMTDVEPSSARPLATLEGAGVTVASKRRVYLVTSSRPRTDRSEDGILLVAPGTLSKQAVLDRVLALPFCPHGALPGPPVSRKARTGDLRVVEFKDSGPLRSWLTDCV